MLVWGTETPVGFRVSPALALRSLPRHIGPEPGAVGPGGVDSDLVLVDPDGASALVLTYRHEAFADEYTLRPWGRYVLR